MWQFAWTFQYVYDQPVQLSACPLVYFSTFIYVHLFTSLFFACLLVFLFTCLYIHLFTCLPAYVPTSPLAYQLTRLSYFVNVPAYIPTCLLFYTCTCSSKWFSACLSTCLPVITVNRLLADFFTFLPLYLFTCIFV